MFLPRLLLECGADPDLATKEGLLPAELAGSKGLLDLEAVIEEPFELERRKRAGRTLNSNQGQPGQVIA